MTTIETREQAYDLPVETVLRLATGRVADRTPDGWTITGIYDHGVVPRGLYDTDLPATVLHDPTQPAPADVIDREALWDAIVAVRDTSPRLKDDAETDDIIDAILDLLPTRTVAQVKAEALREAAEHVESPELGLDSWLRGRAERLEREDKR